VPPGLVIDAVAEALKVRRADVHCELWSLIARREILLARDWSLLQP
jgi:hypothetical protein